jgi:hypothetical protein
MGLHVIIGYDGHGNAARPFPVYVGRDKNAALTAEAASNAVRFERFNNAAGLRKHNDAHDPSKPSDATRELAVATAPTPVAAAPSPPSTPPPLSGKRKH